MISVVLSFSCVFVDYCYCVAKIMPVVIPWTFLQSQTNVVEEVSCDSQAVNNLCDIPVKGDIAQAAQAQSSSTATKTFAQALSNSCNIPTSKLSKPCLKGEQCQSKLPSLNMQSVYLIVKMSFTKGLLSRRVHPRSVCKI